MLKTSSNIAEILASNANTFSFLNGRYETVWYFRVSVDVRILLQDDSLLKEEAVG